jgi:hypothetical protein
MGGGCKLLVMASSVSISCIETSGSTVTVIKLAL